MKKIILFLYQFKLLRTIILFFIRKSMKNEVDTFYLREIFKEFYNIDIGEYSYGGCFDIYKIAPGTRIGKFCSFASGVMIISMNHDSSKVTTHPFLFKPHLGVVQEDFREMRLVDIGHDVWVGQNALILPSVSVVGHGAVIAAGAVVVKDVPPYAIVAGVPAKVVKYRFDEETVKKLLDIQWWNWPLEKIFQNWRDFLSPQNFINNNLKRDEL